MPVMYVDFFISCSTVRFNSAY